MIGKEVLEIEAISINNVKEIMEKYAEEHELSYEQNLTLDHVTKFSKLEKKDSNKLIKELEKIVKKKYAIKIVDILPEDLDDVRLLFAKERIPLKKEDLDKILDIVDKYR